MSYSLKSDGDSLEKKYYELVFRSNFPSYEIFWQKFVVPLTHRPRDPHLLRTDAELATIGKGSHDICLAQLHYTVFLQLLRSYILMTDRNFNLDYLGFSLSALVGAQDCAFELLERFKNPTKYPAWLAKQKKGGPPGAKEAKFEWQNNEKQKNNGKPPLQDIRDYRNHLVHGSIPPRILLPNGGEICPKIGKESNFCDWRTVSPVPKSQLGDFAAPLVISQQAFGETVAYCEAAWKRELLSKLP